MTEVLIISGEALNKLNINLSNRLNSIVIYMKRRYLLAFLLSIAATFFLVAGLRLPTAQRRITLLVSAAASMQDALEAVDSLFESTYPNIEVNYNFGSSGALQRQIEQGAPADIFLAAATRQMDALQEKDLILPDTRRNLLRNSLVLVVPENSSLGITSFPQLIEDNVRQVAVGEFRSVPAGQYAEEVLTNLGILAQLRNKLVFANTVLGVLAAVETGNADAGIVYATDAQISDQVRRVATAPSNLHSPIVYPGAVIKTSRNMQAANTYLQFLESDRAQFVFSQHGFSAVQQPLTLPTLKCQAI